MSLGVIILAGGIGKRMNSDIPKVCHEIAGWPLLQHVVHTCKGLNQPTIKVVVSPNLMNHTAFSNHPFLNRLDTVTQPKPLGTGDAVIKGLEAMPSSITHIMVLSGDVPTLPDSLLQELLEHRSFDAVWVGMELPESLQNMPYGRIISHNNTPTCIKEWSDASPKEKTIPIANSGSYLFTRSFLEKGLKQLKEQDNGEYYLTDLMHWGHQAGCSMKLIETDYESSCGVNTRTDLAAAHDVLQKRWRQEHLNNGVTLINADSITLSPDTCIEGDSIIEGPAWFGSDVTLGRHVKIKPYTSLQGCKVQDYATVGPFAHIRSGTTIENHAHIGNFVEIKNSRIGEHSKVKHLSYIGDTTMERHVNIGAGTITCNYDGEKKHQTHIEEGAMVGANVSLVAPLKVGAYSLIGAGSVITRQVDDNTLALERGDQRHKPLKTKP